MLNDVGFILFNITYGITSVQAIAAGLVGLGQKLNPCIPALGELLGNLHWPKLSSDHSHAVLQDGSAGVGWCH